jgi:glycosyltransferase involved in cell wall biosynthesis
MFQHGPADVAPPILLVGPSAISSGASLSLLALLRWTERALPAPPRAVLLASGPLHPEFRAAGARVLGEPTSPAHVAERVARRLGRPKVAKAARIARHGPLYLRPPRPLVVFASTVQAAGPSLRFLGSRTRLVTHAFEPGELLDELVNPTMMARLAERTSLWLAASEQVAAGLVARGVPDHRVLVVPPFLDVPEVDSAAVRAARDRMGSGSEEVVVGGVGRSDWRDGPDAFLRMASVLHRRWPDLPVRFVWAGAPEGGPSRWILDHDVRHARLADVFTFVGGPGGAETWVGAFDVLAVTSRVDPVPPAALFAGAAGVPTVAFSTRPEGGSPGPVGAATGARSGLGEVAAPVVDDLGVEVVPYLDVEGMARRVAELAGDPACRERVGSRRLDAVAAMRSVDDQAAALWELLEITAYGRTRPLGVAA